MGKISKTGILILVVIGISILMLARFSREGVEVSEIPNPAWQQEYADDIARKGITSEYLEDTAFLDYNSEEIQAAIKEIESKAINEEHAVQLAADYVYTHVKYDWYESDSVCINKPASRILRSESGQCDTQSRVLVSILRGMGIASTPVAGCIGIDPDCKSHMAVTGERLPVYQELTDKDLEESTISRGSMSRAGGLHTWVRAYLPSKGWIDIESTAGIFADNTCASYLEEYIPKTIAQECMSFNKSFAEACRIL